ncbi:MAG: copper resistance protein B [Sphingomicrobium sp.]
MMNMPGMSMPGMKMPPAKKSSGAKKAASPAKTKKAAAAQSAKSNRATATRKPTMPKKKMPANQGMSSMPGMQMPAGQDMKSMPGMTMPSGTDMSAMPGMSMPSGTDMQSMPGMTMPGHDRGAMQPVSGADASGTNLPAGDAPPPPIPTDRAADQVYGASAMAMGLHHLQTFHGGQKISQIMVNLLDYQANRGRDGFEWVGQGWYGGDINRVFVKSEGDGTFRDGVGRAEVQALYSHAIGAYFNLQGGVRYDFKPNPSRAFATATIEGLAPSFFDLEASLFLSNKGELLGRLEGSYDQRITQRLILQPRVEINLAAQNSREIRSGAGLSDAEIGLRLRYDIRRESAPYVGVQYKRAFGDTRRFLRGAGEDPGGWSLLTGIHVWF